VVERRLQKRWEKEGRLMKVEAARVSGEGSRGERRLTGCQI
jgi:hypothetical protein